MTTEGHVTGVQIPVGDYLQNLLCSSFAELLAGFLGYTFSKG